jgi:DHA1 family bicyclomycin/chloramphenicol resistance-like MFS transporter
MAKLHPLQLRASAGRARLRAMSTPAQSAHRSPDIHFTEFVALMAVLIGITALSIDIMLPALADIVGAYGVDGENDRQLIITFYLAGFALGQPFVGPLSDRFGRKPVLIVGLALYLLGAALALIAPSFSTLLAARALQGMGAASPRITSMAIVRDRFVGRHMARVMSFIMMVFIIVPIMAPTIGQGIVLLGHWSWIFAFMLCAAALALTWSALRLPETRAPEDRILLSVAALSRAFKTVVTSRRTVGYSVAMGFLFSALMAYVGTAQQIFVDVYGLGSLFPLMFGGMAACLALASFTNSRLVGKLGMRRVSHTALIAYILVNGCVAAFGFPARPPLWVLGLSIGGSLYCFGLIAPNFNALAMEPMGHVAGMAASAIGFYTAAAGAFFGWIVGQQFDGSVRPLTIGFAIFGLLAMITVLITERGVLMRTAEAETLAKPPQAS